MSENGSKSIIKGKLVHATALAAALLAPRHADIDIRTERRKQGRDGITIQLLTEIDPHTEIEKREKMLEEPGFGHQSFK